MTGNGNRLCGQGDLGGVWEWTSSPLRKWEGFEPMSLYPAYTGKTALTIAPPPPFFCWLFVKEEREDKIGAIWLKAYVADFFDEKHNIVLGGSWATHPRIAGRRVL